jgi:hypothetical protein
MPHFKIPTGIKIFGVIWLLILALPFTREVFQAYLYSRQFPVTNRADIKSTHGQLAEQLHQQYPDSIEMSLWYSQVMYGIKRNERIIDNLDELRKKNPKNLQLAAAEIQLIANEFLNHRSFQKIPASKVPLMKKAAQIAFESGQKQPKNAFWPLMESGFYIYANQPTQAREAMKRLNRCVTYDDYGLQITKERIHFIERHIPIIWEEKIGLTYSWYYSNFWFFTATSESATNQALSAKRQGHNEQALKIIAPMLKGLGIAERDSTLLLGSLIAKDKGYKSLRAFFQQRERSERNTFEEREALKKSVIHSWEKFSKDNGHPKLTNLANFILIKRDENKGSHLTQREVLWSQDLRFDSL